MLRELPPVKTYEAEYTVDDMLEEYGPENITITRGDDASFTVEGAWAKALVNRINIYDRESMMYFERSLNKFGVINKLREAGCKEGDIVHIDDVEFSFVE